MFNLIGGMGSIEGPILGAIVLTGANELLFSVGYYKMIAYGLMITLVIRFLPGGLISLPSVVAKRIKRLGMRKEARSVGTGTIA
jgi:branched-chain amino acid transport system permease protein